MDVPLPELYVRILRFGETSAGRNHPFVGSSDF